MAERRNPVPIVAAVVVGIVLILAVRSIAGGDGGTAAPEPGPTGVPTARPSHGPCVAALIAASSEKAALLGQIAKAYTDSTPVVNGRCAAVDVVSKASGGAMDTLARGWDESVDGPFPDVWTPASSSWTVLLRQRLAAQDKPNMVPDEVGHVAETPLVIAMPRPMAQALGWPSTPIGWSDVLSLARDPQGWGSRGHPEWGAFRLGKTNPNFSTSGLNATIGTYFAATGTSSDLSTADIEDPKVQDYVRAVESAVVHYGDTTLTFLSNLQRADDRGQGLSYVSAVTIEEKSIWDYNQGNPTGDPATLGDHGPPHTPLVAVYPKEGTLLSDNPYVILDAPWAEPARQAVARDFLAFLQRPEQQARFQRAAFRTFDGRPGSAISAANGMIPTEPANVLAPPSPTVLDAIQQSWGELRKRARVLLVMDVSGSMGDAVPQSGDTKLELAKRAAINALDEFAPDDDVGLWIFTSDLPPGDSPYLELLPVGPLGPRVAAFRQAIGSLIPLNATPLYTVTRAATRAMREDYDPSRINAVILLTDGKNDYPPDVDLDGVVRELQSQTEGQAIRVFAIAYGADADLPTLQRISAASRATAYNAADPASIDKVFTAVVSNF
jgi:Ca-activated chloride channel family protein